MHMAGYDSVRLTGHDRKRRQKHDFVAHLVACDSRSLEGWCVPVAGRLELERVPSSPRSRSNLFRPAFRTTLASTSLTPTASSGEAHPPTDISAACMSRASDRPYTTAALPSTAGPTRRATPQHGARHGKLGRRR